MRRHSTGVRSYWSKWSTKFVVKVAVLAIVVALGGTFWRAPLLRTAGSILVVDQPLSSADAVVIGIDAGAAGVLEAADLIHNGLASRVAVFNDPPDSVDQEFIRRGVPYEDKAAEMRKLLGRLSVTSVEQIPRPASGTEAEGQLLRDWCDSRKYRTVIVVTTTDHSRRAARVLRRAFRGRPTVVMIRPARFSRFQVDDWWQSRAGAREGIVELQKLLLDVLRHPFS